MNDYDITLRPGFDVLTMIDEWRDYLDTNGFHFEGKLAAEMLSKLTALHSTMFRMDLRTMGVLWDEIEGQVTVNPDLVDAIERGFIDPPTMEEVDLAWMDAFDAVVDDLDAITTLLFQIGEL